MKKIVDLQIKPVKKEAVIHSDELNLIEDFGPEGDAYGGPGDRQLTLLGEDDIQILNCDRERGLCIKRFTANITVSGSAGDLKKGQIWNLGETQIKISDFSKKCYDECLLRCEDKRVCRLPTTARFASVIKGGTIKIDDPCSQN